MTYATLMVHLELGRSNAGLLGIAAELASRFDAGVVGIAARRPLNVGYGDGFLAGDLYEQDRSATLEEIKAAEGEFRKTMQGRVASVEWRSTQMYAYLADYLANEARCADLLLTGVTSSNFIDASRAIDTGELLLQVGRPVLVVPSGAAVLKLEHVLIGWKDTRETRRAVADALPFLNLAGRVSVIEIAAQADMGEARKHVADVVGWLARHHIDANGSALLSTGDDAEALYATGQDMGVDLLVAGAYGHSRLREWVLGGVTRDLLLRANRCSLVSH